jgi:hypothetical protein
MTPDSPPLGSTSALSDHERFLMLGEEPSGTRFRRWRRRCSTASTSWASASWSPTRRLTPWLAAWWPRYPTGWTSLLAMVGARGFEPPTSASRTLRAAKLRHAPTEEPRGVTRLRGLWSIGHGPAGARPMSTTGPRLHHIHQVVSSSRGTHADLPDTAPSPTASPAGPAPRDIHGIAHPRRGGARLSGAPRSGRSLGSCPAVGRPFPVGANGRKHRARPRPR